MKLILLLGLSLLFTLTVNSQDQEPQKVSMKEVVDICGDRPQLRGFSKAYCLYLNNKPAKMKEILSLMKNMDLKSYQMMKFSKKLEQASKILTFTGIGLTLYPIIQFFSSDRDPDWTFTAIGSGMVLLTIPISEWSLNRSNKAVKRHRSLVSINSNSQLKFKISQKMLGLSVGF